MVITVLLNQIACLHD